MGASEEFYGEGHESTFTVQPKPTTRRVQFSEMAHHKDGDDNHGFSVPIESDMPGSHDFNPDR